MIDAAALLLAAAIAMPADSAARAPSPADSVAAALVSAQVSPGDELRVHGAFGRLQARVSTIGPRGLDLVLAPHGLTDPAPTRSLSWSEIDRIERGTSRRKDGQRIGLVCGAFLGFALTMSWVSNLESGDAAPFSLIVGIAAGVGGALIGRGVGGAVGAAKVRWKRVYER